MVQVPNATNVTVEPATVHVATVCDVNVSGSNDDAEAYDNRLKGAVLMGWLGIALKRIDCVPSVMLNDCGTDAAALKLALPG